MNGNSTSASRKRQTVKKGRTPNTPGFTPIWMANGCWAIRVGRGVNRKTVYLGRSTDDAETKFKQVKANLRQGRAPTFSQPTLNDLVVKFLQAKESAVVNRDIKPQVFNHYRLAAKKLLSQLVGDT